MAEYVEHSLLNPSLLPNNPVRVRSLDRVSASGSSTAYVNAVANSGNASGKSVNTNYSRDQTVVSPFISPNQFDPLSDDDDGELPIDDPLPKKQPKIRVPLIYIMGSSINDVFQLLENCAIPRNEDFLLKHNRTSVQFLTKSKEVFDKTVAALKTKSVQFFTHGTSDTIPAKFVLSGLPLADISKLKEELARFDIHPKDIKVLSTSKTSVGTYALYILYFPRGAVKIQDLRKIKALFNVVVSWRFYEKRIDDAAQCYRCQRFGHGSTNCNLAPKCVKCGGKHLTNGCTLPKKAQLSSKDNGRAQLKCANCGASHTANFRGCPARKTYLDEMEKRKKKPNVVPPRMTNSTFPNLGNQRSAPSRPSLYSAGRATYAEVSALGATQPTDNPPKADLFTISEFLSLARDMFICLRRCHNKEQQFSALSELMMKYLYNV